MTRVSGMTEMNRINRMTTVWHKIYFNFCVQFFQRSAKKGDLDDWDDLLDQDE